MAKYVVVFDMIGVGAENPKEDLPTYHSRGEEVELSEKEAKRLLDLGAVKASEDATEEDALPEPLLPSSAPNEPAEAPAPEAAAAAAAEGERLTHKQQLKARATELGISTEGTSAELEARIAEEEAKQGE